MDLNINLFIVKVREYRMAENNGNVSVGEEQKKKKSKLDLAMEKYRKAAAAEERVKFFAEKERKAEEERKRRKEEKKAAEKAVEKAKKELAAVRSFADVKKDASNIRKQYAVKGFFELLDECNADGTRDFTDAYNFIGNTKWLLETLHDNLKVNASTNKLEIDIDGMRSAVFAKKKEIEDIIENFKSQLDAEWKKLQELEKSASGSDSDQNGNAK